MHHRVRANVTSQFTTIGVDVNDNKSSIWLCNHCGERFITQTVKPLYHHLISAHKIAVTLTKGVLEFERKYLLVHFGITLECLICGHRSFKNEASAIEHLAEAHEDHVWEERKCYDFFSAEHRSTAAHVPTPFRGLSASRPPAHDQSSSTGCESTATSHSGATMELASLMGMDFSDAPIPDAGSSNKSGSSTRLSNAADLQQPNELGSPERSSVWSRLLADTTAERQRNELSNSGIREMTAMNEAARMALTRPARSTLPPPPNQTAPVAQLPTSAAAPQPDANVCIPMDRTGAALHNTLQPISANPPAMAPNSFTNPTRPQNIPAVPNPAQFYPQPPPYSALFPPNCGQPQPSTSFATQPDASQRRPSMVGLSLNERIQRPPPPQVVPPIPTNQNLIQPNPMIAPNLFNGYQQPIERWPNGFPKQTHWPNGYPRNTGFAVAPPQPLFYGQTNSYYGQMPNGSVNITQTQMQMQWMAQQMQPQNPQMIQQQMMLMNLPPPQQQFIPSQQQSNVLNRNIPPSQHQWQMMNPQLRPLQQQPPLMAPAQQQQVPVQQLKPAERRRLLYLQQQQLEQNAQLNRMRFEAESNVVMRPPIPYYNPAEYNARQLENLHNSVAPAVAAAPNPDQRPAQIPQPMEEQQTDEMPHLSSQLPAQCAVLQPENEEVTPPSASSTPGQVVDSPRPSLESSALPSVDAADADEPIVSEIPNEDSAEMVAPPSVQILSPEKRCGPETSVVNLLRAVAQKMNIPISEKYCSSEPNLEMPPPSVQIIEPDERRATPSNDPTTVGSDIDLDVMVPSVMIIDYVQRQPMETVESEQPTAERRPSVELSELHSQPKSPELDVEGMDEDTAPMNPSLIVQSAPVALHFTPTIPHLAPFSLVAGINECRRIPREPSPEPNDSSLEKSPDSVSEEHTERRAPRKNTTPKRYGGLEPRVSGAQLRPLPVEVVDKVLAVRKERRSNKKSKEAEAQISTEVLPSNETNAAPVAEPPSQPAPIVAEPPPPPAKPRGRPRKPLEVKKPEKPRHRNPSPPRMSSYDPAADAQPLGRRNAPIGPKARRQNMAPKDGCENAVPTLRQLNPNLPEPYRFSRSMPAALKPHDEAPALVPKRCLVTDFYQQSRFGTVASPAKRRKTLSLARTTVPSNSDDPIYLSTDSE